MLKGICKKLLGVENMDWLRALKVSVRDYHLSHDAATGRALPIETFHAKLVLADDTLAYVGSANLLGSSEGLLLEAGLLKGLSQVTSPGS